MGIEIGLGDVPMCRNEVAALSTNAQGLLSVRIGVLKGVVVHSLLFTPISSLMVVRGFYLRQNYTSQHKGREEAKVGIVDNALLFGKKHVWYSIHHLNGKEEVPPSHG
ncbi:uncharacterized protein [Malus domestica]|uniref:uncharacterized protein n=1 Tax=Malus domestica TaxID=3750 RepID=UPI0039757DB2